MSVFGDLCPACGNQVAMHVQCAYEEGEGKETKQCPTRACFRVGGRSCAALLLIHDPRSEKEYCRQHWRALGKGVHKSARWRPEICSISSMIDEFTKNVMKSLDAKLHIINSVSAKEMPLKQILSEIASTNPEYLLVVCHASTDSGKLSLNTQANLEEVDVIGFLKAVYTLTPLPKKEAARPMTTRAKKSQKRVRSLRCNVCMFVFV